MAALRGLDFHDVGVEVELHLGGRSKLLTQALELVPRAELEHRGRDTALAQGQPCPAPGLFPVEPGRRCRGPCRRPRGHARSKDRGGPCRRANRCTATRSVPRNRWAREAWRASPRRGTSGWRRRPNSVARALQAEVGVAGTLTLHKAARPGVALKAAALEDCNVQAAACELPRQSQAGRPAADDANVCLYS